MSGSVSTIEPNSSLSRSLQKKGYYINERKEWVEVSNNTLIKILLVNQFICDFVYSCQCVWIMCLITIYQPSKFVDIIILGLPFYASNRIKTWVIESARKSESELSFFLKLVMACYAVMVVGHYLLIVSTEPQRMIYTIDFWVSYGRLRVFIAGVGLFLTQSCLEIVYTVNEQMEAIAIKGELEYEIEEVSQMSLIAKISAYLLCVFALMKVDTYRNLYCMFSEVYYVCILLCFTGIVLMLKNNRFKVMYKESPVFRSQESFKVGRNTIHFKGYNKLWTAPIRLKIYSIVLCCTNVIKFTVRLYCTAWMAESFLGDQEMMNYKHGIQLGSILLCLFTFPNYLVREFIRARWKNWSDKRFKRIVYEVVFIGITILTITSCFLSINIESPLLIIVSILLSSLLIGNLQIFLQNDQEFIGVNVPEFQICQNSVFRIAHYITLFGIPVFLHLVEVKLKRINAIYFIIGSSVVLLIVKFYILVRVHKRKSKPDPDVKSAADLNKMVLLNIGRLSASVTASSNYMSTSKISRQG